MKNTALLVTLLISYLSFAQVDIKTGWEYWNKAELDKALTIAEENINTNEGKHLKGNILQVRGQYQQAIETYESIGTDYNAYQDVLQNKLNIHFFHLKNMENAKALVDQIDNQKATIYAAATNHPITVECSGSFTVPMLTNEPLNPYIPIISGSINGTQQNIAFDTGGNYLILTKKAAEKLNIAYDSTLYFMGQQGFGTSKMWVGTVNELVLGKEVKLSNVPVTILEKMNTEIIIFGTTILKEFLTTIDYPNNQFVFTTKDNTELIKAHRNQYKGNSMDFIMWGDHYMMGQGIYNTKKVNMFFDSGLVVVGQSNGKIVQSWLCLSKPSMENLGIEEKDKTGPLITTQTNDVLSFAGINNPNVILSLNGGQEFKFGGIYCDLLISHGILKEYAWTIDFDKMVYHFKK